MSLFSFNKSKHDGRASECKECKKAKDKKYFEANKSRVCAKSKEWYENNKDYALERHKKYFKEYMKNKRAELTAKEARRRSLKLLATPSWLTDSDLQNIETEYKLCAWASSVMGEAYHVDHIVPLKGKAVCGLHVPWNLRVIPAKENISKGNKHVV